MANQEIETTGTSGISSNSEDRSNSNTSENVPPKEDSFSSASGEKVQSPLTQRYQTCKANLQSTSKMNLSSELVYSQELSLPDAVEVISVKPSAGNSCFLFAKNHLTMFTLMQP
ncbi:hypothetical protein AB205_0103170 [Aquarana catesbeiana]|uniref:Uncharacterized protein n=1 Tax=Aquarana catesbeiana TaxID=8400 RepID=A0A2G9RB93_AQUCT|nr:hypothetical protein AB205_0103170 [Aquarana catesbeiana]